MPSYVILTCFNSISNKHFMTAAKFIWSCLGDRKLSMYKKMYATFGIKTILKLFYRPRMSVFHPVHPGKLEKKGTRVLERNSSMWSAARFLKAITAANKSSNLLYSKWHFALGDTLDINLRLPIYFFSHSISLSLSVTVDWRLCIARCNMHIGLPSQWFCGIGKLITVAAVAFDFKWNIFIRSTQYFSVSFSIKLLWLVREKWLYSDSSRYISQVNIYFILHGPLACVLLSCLRYWLLPRKACTSVCFSWLY